MTSVLVRPVEPADSPQWQAMRTALWPNHANAWHGEEIAAFFARPRVPGDMPEAVHVAYEATVPSRLLGFTELSRRPYAEGCETSPVGFLEGWYVVTEVRRLGVGRALVDAAFAWAREKGCSEFASDALVDNEVSREAHVALGFEEVEVIRCFRRSLT